MTERRVAVISIFMENVPLSVPSYQRRVVEHFFGHRVDLYQIFTSLTHGEQIDRILHRLVYEYYLILDIDAIPLCGEVLEWLCSSNNEIRGNMQRSNHLGSSELYVAPSFMCFSRGIFEQCDFPSFEATSECDVGEWFCRVARSRGFQLSFLSPISSIGAKQWPLLSNEKEVGIGTTFGWHGKPMSFHNYEIRKKKNQAIFIRKCKEILGEDLRVSKGWRVAKWIKRGVG